MGEPCGRGRGDVDPGDVGVLASPDGGGDNVRAVEGGEDIDDCKGGEPGILENDLELESWNER